MARSTKPSKRMPRDGLPRKRRLYTLEVCLLNGPLTKQFVQANPVVSRTIQLRGDQTLADLHRALFTAFDREEEHMYEFQLFKGPMDPDGARYVLPGALRLRGPTGKRAAGRVDETTLDALGLEVGQQFGYWFDFGDNWFHQVHVEGIEAAPPGGKYPKVSKRVGKSPPQYPDLDEERDHSPGPIRSNEAADAACLVGEHHLSKGAYEKAIEAFTRAIENNPAVDAYEGRARAYRGLADADERRAGELRREIEDRGSRIEDKI